MDITSLRTFLAAASTGSFAEAANRVNASPSSVTERVKQLENRLGAVLFERDKRGCRLTVAGSRFIPFAQQSVRAWDLARQNIGLPERFAKSISLGGQYFFWDYRLMDWLSTLREIMPDVAFHVTAGASARLNRDLIEGFLDMAILYDPVFHRDLRAEPLYSDELVLVTGGKPENWQEDYVRIEWGQELGNEMAARLDAIPKTGLVLDLGVRSAQILINQKLSGFLPARAAMPLIDEGKLSLIKDAPRYDFPAFVCWRRDMDQDLAEAIIGAMKDGMIN